MIDVRLNNSNKEYPLVLLTFFLLSADFKETVGFYYIIWVLVLLFVLLYYRQWSIPLNEISGIVATSYILAILILLMSLGSKFELNNILHSLKITVMFCIFTPIFINLPFESGVFYKGIILALIVNSVCLIMGQYLNNFAWDTGNGRWANFLNYPGSLYKAGILVFPYILYELCAKFRLKSIILMLLALACLFFDGSRTGISAIIVCVIWVFVNILIESVITKKVIVIKKFFKATFLVVLLTLIALYFWGGGISGSAAYQRISAVSKIISENSFQNSLYKIDNYRGYMIDEAIKQINNNPFIGKGFGNTRYEVVVHNTYLQIFADLGFLGFVCVMIIYFAPLLLYIRNLKLFKAATHQDKKIFVGSCGGLILFIFFALFHPFSVEITDWSIYFLSLTILYKTVKSRRCFNEKSLNHNSNL
jgi:O-antigen ligase